MNLPHPGAWSAAERSAYQAHTPRLSRLKIPALSRSEYLAGLAAAGLEEPSVTFTHEDGSWALMDHRVTATTWRKSSYTTSNGGNCVELASQENRVLVRDTKDRTGPMLRFAPDAWHTFAEQVKARDA
jgi:Domain of unknown function (DUF397)